MVLCYSFTMPRLITSVSELPGVGDILRQRIVTVLSPQGGEDDAVRRINEDPYVLLSVPGIGAQRIVRILSERFAVTPPEVMQRMAEHHKSLPGIAPATHNTQLTNNGSAVAEAPPAAPARSWVIEQLPGVGWRLAERIEKVLGASPGPSLPPYTPSEVRAYIEGDPYRLLRVPGLGFTRVDRIAREFFSVDPDDPRRHQHANEYLVRQSTGVLTLGEYRRRRAAMGVADQKHELAGVQMDNGFIWDADELEAERRLAKWALAASSVAVELKPVPERVESEMLAFGLNEEQRTACWAGLNLPAVALTGGAGTGKTTTIAALASVASRRGLNVHVMAFAGKGSERIAEALREFGLEPETQGPFGNTVEDPNRSYTYYGRVFVSTIHRGLAATGSGTFELDELAADIVVLDEASMLPNTLLADVLERMRPEARLMLVGDPRQLPPIQFGAPFEAFIALGLPHYQLLKNYRQANQEGIFTLAEAVRSRTPVSLTSRAGVRALLGPAFEDNLLMAVEEIRASSVGHDLLRWQVVCALNVTRERLNALLQERLNPAGEKLATYREYRSGLVMEVREGDKVVVQRNDYELGIFNGQTGIVLGWDDDEDALIVRIGSSTVLIAPDLVSDLLRLGYAITTHKAQGSGFSAVAVAEPGVVTLHPNRWTYTSITRASQQLYIISALNEGSWWSMALREPPPQPSSLEKRAQFLRLQAQDI